MAVTKARTQAPRGIAPSSVRVVRTAEARETDSSHFGDENPNSDGVCPVLTSESAGARRKMSQQPLSVNTGLPSPELEDIFSPSLRAMQNYYQVSAFPVAGPHSAIQLGKETQKRCVDSLDEPRRHSLMVSTRSADLFSQRNRDINGLRSALSKDLDRVKERTPVTESIQCESPSSAVFSTCSRGDVNDEANNNDRVQQRRIENPLSPKLIGCLPYEYTHARLRDWGAIYYRNKFTADAYVTAIPLSAFQSSSSPSTEGEAAPLQSESRNVCVRIVPPGSSTRSPALIRKHIRLGKRSSPPKGTSAKRRSPIHKASARYEMRSRSSCSSSSPKRRNRLVSASNPSSPAAGLKSSFGLLQIDAPENDAFTVHIEYALHRLPLLAAILLSGHILRGDTIELPLPYPSAWPDVFRWMYIFDSPVTDEMRENISYLAGTIEDVE